MRKLFFSMIAAALCFGQSLAADTGTVNTRGGMPTQPSVEAVDLLYETFANVTGDGFSTQIDTSKFDNPGDWAFTNAYAAEGGILIRKGGTVTTPPVAALTGNATIYFSTRPYENPEIPIDYDSLHPHSLTVDNGELNQSTFDEMVSMESIYIYGAGPETRVTLTADHDIILSSIKLSYGAVGANFYDRYTEVSVPEGEYYNPFEVTLTPYMGQGAFNDDGSHNITVYTLDGTTPTRASSRYDGTPIKIDRTTTLLTGTIFGNGGLCVDKPVVYTFPQSSLPEIPANTFTVNVSNPGSLKSLLLDIDADIIEGLILTGTLNGSDLKYLAGGEGRTAAISYLDMSEVTFEYDGTEYMTIVDAPEGGMGTTYYYNYYLSENNYDENSGGSVWSKGYNCYRNNMAGAFSRNKTLKAVILPKSIPSIGERMFDRCEKLESVSLPDGITSVGYMAFYYCTNLQMYDFPADLEEVGSSAFAGIKLGNVKFDRKVRLSYGAFQSSTIASLEMPMPSDSIPAYAFAFCDKLVDVNIGEGLKYIGDQAFGYTKLSDPKLPSTIEEFERDPFYGCSFVDKILPEGGIRYIGKIAYRLADQSLSEYTVKDGTVSLAQSLFSFSSALKFIIPASVENIGEETFACAQITSMPDMPGLRRIGQHAFRDCPKLARITIPESVEYIDWTAFSGCNALWNLNYNAIDAECPYGLGLRDLERINIGDKVRRLPKGIYTDNTGIVDAVLPRSLEIIEPEAFSGCVNLRSVRFSDNITKISDYAFYNCRSLTDIHWPARLDSIGASAFSKCESLKSVSLPEGLRSVGGWAFAYSPEVTSLYIASTVQEIEYGAFYFDNHDKKMTITSTAEIPPYYEWGWARYNEVPTVKVPTAYMESYRTEPWWSGSNVGINVNLVALGEIAASNDESTTDFSSSVDNTTDLTDTVIGNVYVTLGEEDGYDQSDGALVINSTMEEEYAEAIGGMAPGASDLHNRFNGLVVMVPSGHGSIVVNCQTIGSRLVTVKFGEDAPSFYTKDSKGDITIDYDVDTDTYVYIYASEASADSQMTTRSSDGDCIRIYSIGVTPEDTAVDSIADSISPIVEYYTLDGIRVANPSEKGVYIARRSDGSTSKVYLR